MLVDYTKIKVKGGKGGDGVVSFNRNMMEQGPVGGSGGRGGSIILEGVSDIGALNQFRFKKDFYAEDGKDGMRQNRDGADGNDLLLRVPAGTVIKKENGEFVGEITKIGEQLVIARGGKGGRGNFHFRSSRNTSPQEFEEGKEGDEGVVELELKLIADVGFVGLPNIGKSTLLNELTNAKSKVANYPFTTLEPSLGAYYEIILADIPGLIKGASEGRGLGIKFLKHVERTQVLFHFISADSKTPLEDYQTIRDELKNHSKELIEKPEYIILSRVDNVSSDELKKKINTLKKTGKEIIPISILEEGTLQSVKKILNKIKDEKLALS